MSPISDSAASTASITHGELSPLRSTHTNVPLIHRRLGGVGGGGGSQTPQGSWIVPVAWIGFIFLFAIVSWCGIKCWVRRIRRQASQAAIAARRERAERDRPRDEIEMSSLGRQVDVEPPPDYAVAMIEQRVPSPIHLRDDDRDRLLA